MSNTERLKNVEELIDINKIDIGKIVIEGCKKDFWYFAKGIMCIDTSSKSNEDFYSVYNRILKESKEDQCSRQPFFIPMDDVNRELLACLLIYKLVFEDGYKEIYYVGKDKECGEKFLDSVSDLIQQIKFDDFIKRKYGRIYYDYNGSFIKVLTTPLNLVSAETLFTGIAADVVIIDDMALNKYFKEICTASAITGRTTQRIIAVPNSGEANAMLKTMESIVSMVNAVNELYN